jgi:ribA/ribD-fused uncharacterized protein
MNDEKKAMTFHFFWKSKSPFSQWYPCKFTDGKATYSCTEQYMMAEKARLFGDRQMEEKIMFVTSPAAMKKYGRRIKNFDPEEWELKRTDIVTQGNFYKFSQNQELKKALLDTGDALLVEASPYDKIWGIGMKKSDPRAHYPIKWLGLNLLGKCLMAVKERVA